RYPALRILVIKSDPGDRGIDAQDRRQRRYAPVRSKSQHRAGLQQGLKRISGLDSNRSDALLGPTTVVDRVIGLNRCYGPQPSETRNIRLLQVLRVLNAKAPIAGAVLAPDFFEIVQCEVIRSVADGMY